MSESASDVIAKSPYFVADWYVETYPDVALSGIDPVQHYLWYGAQMGRDPGPDFSASAYFRTHVDVAMAGHNPLWHYECFGRDEDRDIVPSDLHLAGTDSDIAASEIDHSPCASALAPDPDSARAYLSEVFSRTLQNPPKRYLSRFEHATAARVVAALAACTEHQHIARRTCASIILPCHNRAEEIPRAIGSVLEQSHGHFELIIVDDGSTDGTADLLARYADEPRIQVLTIPHQGVSAARNAGLAAATGDVIFYLDSDNAWTHDFLRLMLIALEVSQADCAYAGLRLQYLHNTRTLGYRGEPFDWDHCLAGNYVDLNVFCHRRVLYQRHGGFDPLLRRMVDWDLVLRYTRHNAPVFCPFIGCLYKDDRSDPNRISISRPYLFRRIVVDKNTQGYDSAAQTLDGLILSISLKSGAAPPAELTALAQVLQDQGHSLQLDGPDSWSTRHPHADDVVVVHDTAAEYVPHPEHLNIAWSDTPDLDHMFQGHMIQPPPRSASAQAAEIVELVKTYVLSGHRRG